ncbi:glutathione S-transferase N-terminal domain-containing protein [Methylobacterium brachiatum]|uniref:Glutathione S-transferase N-terminal domain-containing protein n=1 Tax=Methylobacterium brachiatum TaxID=269660 RepID=A0ABV1R5A8_9HYPH
MAAPPPIGPPRCTPALGIEAGHRTLAAYDHRFYDRGHRPDDRDPVHPRRLPQGGCPFCLKARLFLLEAGQLDRVVLREFVPGTQEETEIRNLLGPKVEKVTFPTAELTPGKFTTESDAIVAHFAERAGVEPEAMPTYQSYLTGVFKNLGALYRENMDFEKRLSPA